MPGAFPYLCMAWYSAWRTPHAREAAVQLSRKAVLAVTTGVLVLTSASFTAFSLFLHPIEVDFGWSRATVTLPYMIAMVAWGISATFFMNQLRELLDEARQAMWLTCH